MRHGCERAPPVFRNGLRDCTEHGTWPRTGANDFSGKAHTAQPAMSPLLLCCEAIPSDNKRAHVFHSSGMGVMALCYLTALCYSLVIATGAPLGVALLLCVALLGLCMRSY